MDCPICNKTFPAQDIASHVNKCLDGDSMQVDPPAPVVVQPPAVIQPTTSTTTTTTTTSGENLSEEARLQEEAYRFWQKKREQEAEDAKMAALLQKQTTSPTPSSPTPSSPTTSISPTPAKTTPVPSPKHETATERDRRLAEELWKQEQDNQRKKEWNSTLELIKDQAKKEAEERLAAELQEKAELEARLKEAKEELQGTDTHAAIDLEGTEFPDTWEVQSSMTRIFDVKRGTDEWKRIESSFVKSLGNQTQVTKIERNQNRTLWTFYFLRRSQIATKNQHDPNEQFLYHGSRTNAYESILKDGFDHRVADMNGAIGAGVYFATHASTSSGYVAGTKKRMLYCRVALGSIGPGQSGLRRPPDRGDGTPYHCVGQVHGGNGMYVIFDNYQSYPEYIVTYK